MILSKQFSFDAAHRLTFHQGECFNLHGHTWNGNIEIGMPDGDVQDMIIDFGLLKEIIKDYFDHKTLVYKKDQGLLEYLRDAGLKHTLLDQEPTAENLAILIKGLVIRLLLDKSNTTELNEETWVSITLFESETSSVTV